MGPYFENMHSIVKPESAWPQPLPRACILIDTVDEQVLRLELKRCGLARLVPESEVPLDSDGRELLARLSGVEHKAESDRLIFDR